MQSDDINMIRMTSHLPPSNRRFPHSHPLRTPSLRGRSSVRRASSITQANQTVVETKWNEKEIRTGPGRSQERMRKEKKKQDMEEREIDSLK
jgi:hypothetical protein